MRSDDKESDLSDLDTSACYLPPKNNIGRSYLMSKAVSTPKSKLYEEETSAVKQNFDKQGQFISNGRERKEEKRKK